MNIQLRFLHEKWDIAGDMLIAGHNPLLQQYRYL